MGKMITGVGESVNLTWTRYGPFITWSLYSLTLPERLHVRFPRAKSLAVNVNSDKNLEKFRCHSPQPLQCTFIQVNGYWSLWGRTTVYTCHDDIRFFLLGTQPPLSHWVLDLKTGPGIVPLYWISGPQPPDCPSLVSFGCIYWSIPLLAAHLSCPWDDVFY